MGVSVLLVCYLPFAADVAFLAPLPDLTLFVRKPVPAEALSEGQRADQAAALGEAQALAQYLARVRNKLVVDRDDLGLLLTALVVLEQFDSAVWNLNPAPTVGEALARVRAYREWLGFIRTGIKRAEERGQKVEPTERYFRRVVRFLDRQYRPLFARAV